MFVVLKTTSNTKWLFKSGAAPLYRSLVTSLKMCRIYLGLKHKYYALLHKYKPGLTNTKGEDVCKSHDLLYTQQNSNLERVWSNIRCWFHHCLHSLWQLIMRIWADNEWRSLSHTSSFVYWFPQRQIFCEVHAGEPPFGHMLLSLWTHAHVVKSTATLFILWITCSKLYKSVILFQH